MVTLGDLIEYDNDRGTPTWAEVVGKTRDRTTGRRVYEVYPLVPIAPGSDTYVHAPTWAAIEADRVDRRVRNDGSYACAWKRMGWLQMGQGDSARFERLSTNVAEPVYASTVSDSDDESTDDTSDDGSDVSEDTDDASWIVSDASTVYSASASDTDESDAEDAPVSPTYDRWVDEAHRSFAQWEPRSPGEARFKETIAALETRMSARFGNGRKKKS